MMKRIGKIYQSMLNETAVLVYKKGMSAYLKDNDPDKALKYLFISAYTGYGYAYGEIAIILYREKNEVDNARKWFKKAEASDALFPEAAYEYGMLKHLEDGEWENGLNYLLMAAKEGYAPAYGDIGIIAYLFQDETKEEAFEWFRKAEEADCLYPPAACYYGKLFIFNKDDWKQSIKYLRQAAEGEYAPAYGALGSVYYYWAEDIDEAERWFVKAEESGCLDASDAHTYGMLLIDDRGDIERGNYFLDRSEKEGY